MTYLLDTNVVSEIRKGDRCHPNVAAWFLGASDSDLFISVLVLGEIRRGVSQVRSRNPSNADRLEAWLDALPRRFAGRIVDVDAAIADQWGLISARRTVPVIDGLIAATAVVRNMTVVTRNTSDIAGLGADVLNPFLPA